MSSIFLVEPIKPKIIVLNDIKLLKLVSDNTILYTAFL
jgi:hypothetical protein